MVGFLRRRSSGARTRSQEGGVLPSGQRAQDARASPWKRLRSLSLSVVLGLVAVVCPASAQPVIDYPDGSTNASGIVISTKDSLNDN